MRSFSSFLSLSLFLSLLGLTLKTREKCINECTQDLCQGREQQKTDRISSEQGDGEIMRIDGSDDSILSIDVHSEEKKDKTIHPNQVTVAVKLLSRVDFHLHF